MDPNTAIKSLDKVVDTQNIKGIVDTFEKVGVLKEGVVQNSFIDEIVKVLDKVVYLDFYATLVCIVCVLLVGRFFISKFKILGDYNIPEPVVGGLVVAFSLTIFYSFSDYKIVFDTSMRDPLMLAFFTSVGLGANFASLRKGGSTLVKFLFIVSIFLVIQNVVGVGLSYAMGQNPLMGLLGGSITLSGGHGTGTAWSSVFSNEPYNFKNGLEVAMACATFGLVLGGIIGGPVARFLIKKNNLQSSNGDESFSGFESPKKERLITASSFIESLALIALALFLGTILSAWAKSATSLPTFVWCLFVGVILRNLLSFFKIHNVFEREVSVIGNVSLSLFLALALMSLNLKELLGLAGPILAILVVQTIAMILFAIFVTFRFMGKDYDAAVFAAGHCGFGMGATPTAIVNMQAITQRYGPSHVAFLVVPMVGAFFIDIINAFVINGFLSFIG